jgi:DNA-binding HxlR family transcriptional regulator
MVTWKKREINKCPISFAYNILGKKWTINIIRDCLDGKKRFNELLKTNPTISNKILSKRLKELLKEDIIKKKEENGILEYSLTEKGMSLKNLIFEMLKFSITYYPDQIFCEMPPNMQSFIKDLEKEF